VRLLKFPRRALLRESNFAFHDFHLIIVNCELINDDDVDDTYPTAKTLPVSSKLASSETPLILDSKMEETSVGAAFAEA
jgi:hypothetical protein